MKKNDKGEREQGVFKELREADKFGVALPKSIPGETGGPCTLNSN